MKKNVVGHMMAAKEPVAAKLRRWNLLPRLICLLLALLIWLVVVDVTSVKQENASLQSGVTDTEA